jgi:hypothetical protein
MALQLYKIGSVEVGSAGASSIAFSSIPQGYTDLKIVSSIRKTGGSTGSLLISLNGSSTNFTQRDLYGNGSTVASGNTTTAYIAVVNGGTTTANTFDNTEIYIPNYAGSTNKSLSSDSVAENNATGDIYDVFTALLWSNTSAINAITLSPTNNSFAQYSTATLYGIL